MGKQLSPAENEHLVQELVDGLGAALGENSLRGGKANRIPGASGYRHQIDVSIHLFGKIVLLECKRFNRPVAIQHALTLAARLQDIREANPFCDVTASLVSTRAVTAGSLKISSHVGFFHRSGREPCRLRHHYPQDALCWPFRWPSNRGHL